MAALIQRWPILIALGIFCLCVALKLNGSSVGVWNEILYENDKPAGLLFSSPKHVRADEWHGWTPAALSQARQTPRFPTRNLSLGGDHAPLLMSVPVAHYSMLFRPQFWGFFIFDFERGFSFFWCAKILALGLASYWFLRELGVRNRGFALFGAAWIFFSGYVQWWFSSPTMLPEMLAAWMICTGCALRFFKQTNHWQLGAAFLLFAFCGVNFLLCVYPAYQIPLLWLMVALLIGNWIEARQSGTSLYARRGVLLTVGAIAVVLIVLIPFWLDARSTLDLVANTDYPGSRRSTGGDLSIFKLFSGVVGFFQGEKIFPKNYENVCEASNFYPLWPAALVCIVAARWRRGVRVSGLLVALTIFIVTLSIYCVTPLPAWITKITFLGLTTERRTLLGIGIATILLGTLFLDRYRDPIFHKGWAIGIGFLSWLIIVALIWNAGRGQPDFFPSGRQIALAVIANLVVIAFFVETQRRWFAAALIALLILSNAAVNPIMRGLAPLIESPAFHEVDKLRAADPQGKWLAYHDGVLAQLVIATGAPILNGNKIIPDFDFLRILDPDGGGKPIYNRYAYVGCELPNESEKEGVKLLQHDLYVIYLSPQTPLLRQMGCRYFLFPEPWPDALSLGFKLVNTVAQSRIYIYQSPSEGGD